MHKDVKKYDLLPYPRPQKYVAFDPEHSVVSEWDFHSILSQFTKTDIKKSKSKKQYRLVNVLQLKYHVNG